MTIASSVFQDNELIPAKYTCDGDNINPPLAFSEVPKEALSLALIIDDPDAPSRTFTHWVLYNIPPSVTQILENATPESIVVGMNDFGDPRYGGPCPPSGTHRYFFKLYALDTLLNIPPEASREAVENLMYDHIIDHSQLIGLYSRG